MKEISGKDRLLKLRELLKMETDEEALLRASYIHSLELAKNHQRESINFKVHTNFLEF